MTTDLEKSGRTAIKRKSMSVPMRWLLEHDKLYGNILDYGCGHGTDKQLVNELVAAGNKHIEWMEGFDPNYWQPPAPGAYDYDVITCVYVLNVIRLKADRDAVIADTLGLLRKGGTAYFAVRRDVRSPGVTARGTWQGNVEPEYLGVKSIYKCSKFEIYELRKEGSDA